MTVSPSGATSSSEIDRAAKQVDASEPTGMRGTVQQSGSGAHLSTDLAGIPDHLQGEFASMRMKISRLIRILDGRRTTLELLESENARLKAMVADQRDYASRLLKRARKAEAALRDLNDLVAHV